MFCKWEVHIFGKLFKYYVTIHKYSYAFMCVCAYMCVYIHMGIKNLNIGWSAVGTQVRDMQNFFPYCTKMFAIVF